MKMTRTYDIKLTVKDHTVTSLEYYAGNERVEFIDTDGGIREVLKRLADEIIDDVDEG